MQIWKFNENAHELSNNWILFFGAYETRMEKQLVWPSSTANAYQRLEISFKEN